MKRLGLIVWILGAVVLGGGLATSDVRAAATRHVDDTVVRVTTTRHITKGTNEYARVKAFLQQHVNAGATPRSLSVGDYSHLGDFVVTWSRQVDPEEARAFGHVPDPPVPSPGPGDAPGDTYSVGSCSMGIKQTWKYEWVEGTDQNGMPFGHWELVEYKKAHVTSCSSHL